jgi:hypothetical protein
MMLFGVAVGLLGAIALTRTINARLPGLASNNAVAVAAAAAAGPSRLQTRLTRH